MAKKISVKKYAGVYYTESTTHKWLERPDRVYWIAFKDACKWQSKNDPPLP
jgi:hypothetical protein